MCSASWSAGAANGCHCKEYTLTYKPPVNAIECWTTIAQRRRISERPQKDLLTTNSVIADMATIAIHAINLADRNVDSIFSGKMDVRSSFIRSRRVISICQRHAVSSRHCLYHRQFALTAFLVSMIGKVPLIEFSPGEHSPWENTHHCCELIDGRLSPAAQHRLPKFPWPIPVLVQLLQFPTPLATCPPRKLQPYIPSYMVPSMAEKIRLSRYHR
jgi:hypothetical protein